MPTDHRKRLASIRRFDQLVAYLRDELGWPIDSDDFEDLTFDYTPEELGIDAKNAAKIRKIKRLRPLVPGQPWGIFFVKFEPKRLPVVALRRILGRVALKKRPSANRSEHQTWVADDLLFVSNYGERGERHIAFAHFSKSRDGHDLPTLKVLEWDRLDTRLHLDAVARELTDHLTWPDDEGDPDAWRERWRAAFKLRHREVITTSKELSDRLAELARAIRDRIRTALAIETEFGPLTKLMKAFRTALVHDLDEARFADMYAQTIAYGLLSARITDPAHRTTDDLAAHMRTNPFLKALMETFLRVGGGSGKAGGPRIDFDELGVCEVLELLDEANMEAIVLDFGDRNPQEDPVIHFYEHFLAAYDKEQKLRRGVFYTPRPVVSHIVRSLDELLGSDFGLTDGLADTTTWGEMAKRHEKLKIPEGTPPGQAFVQILDPATGTGTFLVEVIDLIHNRMAAKWKAQSHGEEKIHALWNQYVPKHLLPRLHGYELLMAPYAIAHLKIGLKLYETGYRFESDERARVYLTNALEPAGSRQLTLDFLPALAHEAQAVNDIKRKQRFTVVVGNPPYSGLSSNMSPWIDGLLKGRLPDGTATASYYHVDGEPLGERKVWLQDDYVKFIRFSQWLLKPDRRWHGCGHVIDFDREALRSRIADLRSKSLSDDAIRKKYFVGKGSKKYPPGDSRGWKLPAARRKIREDDQWDDRNAPVLYRPFDVREMYYVPWMVDWPRTEAMPHMLAGENVALMTCRQSIGNGWKHLLATRLITDDSMVSNRTRERGYIFPLYLYPGVGSADTSLFSRWSEGKGGRTPNLDSGFVEQIAAGTELRFVSDGRGDLRKTFGPEDSLAWIYAVFHSPGCRGHYEAQLKLDFPRVPLPGSVDLFPNLAEAGHDLLALHLLESPKLRKPITSYAGPRTSEVGRVGWSEGTAWLDARMTSGREGHRATKPGTIGFKGVPEAVWDFHIGGYQVCHKWLKDRKGRKLSDEDVAHYQKIVVALSETIRIMAQIDEVIEAHGGWPNAFQTGSEADAASEGTAKVVPFRPPTVEPAREDRYVTCVPLVPLKAAAGGFSDPHDIENDDFEWVAVGSRRRLRKDMFVAQVVGKSMEPTIRDGAWCLFRAPVEGTRQGKIVLVQLRDATDPETGQRYTVKRYKSQKVKKGDSWRHEKITLEPVNPDFEPIVLTGADEAEFQVVAELVDVLERRASSAETYTR